MTRALAAALACLILAACGLSSAGAQGNSATPRHGGSLKIGLATEPRTLDPLYATTSDELEVLRQMFEPLLDLRDGQTLSPRLATSWSFPDPLTLELRLRHGVWFQDGLPFDAGAAVFSLRRELGARGSPRADDLAAVASVESAGADVVTLRLRRPDPALPYRLAGPAGMMVSPAGVTDAGAEYEFGRNPVVSGTGPFEFDFWRRGYHVILHRFGRYWGAQPYLDQLDFTQADREPGLQRLREGDLDVLTELPRQAAAEAAADPGLAVGWRTGFAYSGLELNEAAGRPFAAAARRLAVTAALDPAAITRTALAGIDTPATGPLTPRSWAYQPPAATRGEAPGNGGGFSFTLKVPAQPQDLDEAQVIQRQLASAGIAMLIQPEDADLLVSDLAGHDFDAELVTLGGSPDPDADLYPQFHSGGAQNYGSFSDPKVDADLEGARAAPTSAARRALYADASGRIEAAAAFGFISYPPVFRALGAQVRGLRLRPDGTLDLEGVWLA